MFNYEARKFGDSSLSKSDRELIESLERNFELSGAIDKSTSGVFEHGDFLDSEKLLSIVKEVNESVDMSSISDDTTSSIVDDYFQGAVDPDNPPFDNPFI